MQSDNIPASEARAKADVYAFLAEVLSSHPTEDSVRKLRQLAASLGLACPGGFSLSELDREYMELLVVPNPRYVAPYESVFRDQWPVPSILRPGSNPGETGPTIKGLLMGESTLEVRQCFLEAGLLPEEDLPDHIGNELRFVAYLWTREAEGPADEAQRLAKLRRKFCRDHILKWINQLRGKVSDSDRLGHYRTALQVVEAVLQDD